MPRKTDTLTIRLSPELRAKIDQAQATLPYFPTITSVVERGIVLALDELEDMARVIQRREAKRSAA
jgi:hypothetical protein